MRILRHWHFVAALLVTATAMHAATPTVVPTPSTVAMSYTKGGTLPSARVTIAPSAGTTTAIYFTVNPATLPPWLQIDKTNGSATVAAPVTLTFSPSLVAANSPAGPYTATVEIDSSGLSPVNITVNLTVTNAAPTVTANFQVLPNSNWTPGTTIPTGVLTVKSSGDPVSFTASATPTWINLGATSDVAYSWGTNIPVTFSSSVFDNPTVNSTLTGTITVRAGTTTLPPVPVTITIGQPVATISSVSPKQLPQAIPASQVRTVAIQGTSFANGMTVKLGGVGGTTVTYNCATFTSGTTDAWCLQSTNQFFLRLSSGTLAGASSSGQIVVYLSGGVPAQNGQPAQAGQIAIPVVATPIVYAVTDAASFVQPASGQYLNVAPYEMLSIFGDNLGTAPFSAITFTNGRLPNALTDNAGKGLSVHFTDSTGSPLAADSDAYILLWTANQINVLAPSSLPLAGGGQELKLSVSVGSSSSSSSPSDSTNTFNVVAASPGLLTLGGTQAVVVNADGTVNSNSFPAKFGSTIVLYLSGMGVPVDGSAFAGNPGPLIGSYPQDCAMPSSYIAAQNFLHAPWQTFDGAIVDRSILGPFALPPCFDPGTVSVKIGNITLSNVVTYAGFTPDSIAGLYQVNVSVPLSSATVFSTLTPAALSTPQQYPIQVMIGSAASQVGVNMYLSK